MIRCRLAFVFILSLTLGLVYCEIARGEPGPEIGTPGVSGLAEAPVPVGAGDAASGVSELSAPADDVDTSGLGEAMDTAPALPPTACRFFGVGDLSGGAVESYSLGILVPSKKPSVEHPSYFYVYGLSAARRGPMRFYWDRLANIRPGTPKGFALPEEDYRIEAVMARMSSVFPPEWPWFVMTEAYEEYEGRAPDGSYLGLIEPYRAYIEYGDEGNVYFGDFLGRHCSGQGGGWKFHHVTGIGTYMHFLILTGLGTNPDGEAEGWVVMLTYDQLRGRGM